MANNPLVFLPIFLLIITTMHHVVESKTNSSSFIKASCKVTQYPTLCESSLFPYAATIRQSPRQLAQTALKVGLFRAQTAKRLAMKLTKSKGLKANEYNALKDCSSQMSDSVDRIKQSCHELKQIFTPHPSEYYLLGISNVQTWVSAALTDQTSCLDGFYDNNWLVPNGKKALFKTQITTLIVDAQQTTSNALALINELLAGS